MSSESIERNYYQARMSNICNIRDMTELIGTVSGYVLV